MSAEEQTRRAVKAARIADLCSRLCSEVPALNAQVFARATQPERDAYARCASATTPSEETWQIVVAILRDREARA